MKRLQGARGQPLSRVRILSSVNDTFLPCGKRMHWCTTVSAAPCLSRGRHNPRLMQSFGLPDIARNAAGIARACDACSNNA